MSDELYAKLAEKIMFKDSKLLPGIFKMVAPPEAAELLLAMPGTTEQLADKVGRPLDEVEDICKGLYRKGAALKSFKGGGVGYKLVRDVGQFHDATILWPEAPDSLAELWREFMEKEYPIFARMLGKILPAPVMRVIPIEEPVETGGQQVLAMESVNEIIENSEVRALTKCACRAIENKCGAPLEVCLQLGNGARYALDRGTGREVSKQEALEIMAKAEEAGLVHVTMNKAMGSHFICNCCGCCCISFPLLLSEGLSLCGPSRFEAKVDPAICNGCGACETKCYFEAIEFYDDDNESRAKVLDKNCMGCGLCRVECPEQAIAMIEVRPPESVPQ